MSELKVTEGVMKGEWSDWKEWNVMKVTEWHARRHEFTAINEINASEEQAAQADKGDQFQFISIRNEKTEWNWTKCDARWSRRRQQGIESHFISFKEIEVVWIQSVL